jgi:hypothetical protein
MMNASANIAHYHVIHGGSVRIGINLPNMADVSAIVDAMAGSDLPIVEVWAVTVDGSFRLIEM